MKNCEACEVWARQVAGLIDRPGMLQFLPLRPYCATCPQDTNIRQWWAEHGGGGEINATACAKGLGVELFAVTSALMWMHWQRAAKVGGQEWYSPQKGDFKKHGFKM